MVIIIHQNLCLGKYWKLFWATLRDPSPQCRKKLWVRIIHHFSGRIIHSQCLIIMWYERHLGECMVKKARSSEYIKCLMALYALFTPFWQIFLKKLPKILWYPWGHSITQRWSGFSLALKNKAFPHVVTAALLVFQNNHETPAVLLSQTCPVGVELYFCVETSFSSNKFAWF